MERELFTSNVERDAEKLLHASNTHTPKHFSILNIEMPNTQLVQEATVFAKKELDEIMLNHSQRVFLLGRIVSQNQFPEWKINYEDYFLMSILDDIGVAPKYHLTMSRSFELKGAMPEAINWYTDFVDGKIQPIGQLIQVATALNVIGAHPDLYNKDAIDGILQQWPRKNFNHHFAGLMERRMKHEPGSHTTFPTCSGFVDNIRNSPAMAKYDE